MPKNIVLCCDGTGNEISQNISNVLKLYRTLRKTAKTEPEQRVFYDPGVGTIARPNPWNKFWQDTKTVFGLATGYGLDDNVLSCYRFLIDNYSDGDDIFLFGFSRGAYTVRVLAALIQKVGLLSPQQANLADEALAAYKQTSLQAEQETVRLTEAANAHTERDQPLAADDRAAQFARIVSARWPTIKFVGVWDTVASVIVPQRDGVRLFRLEELAYTRSNPCVRIFRQAISIDERRRMFRILPWGEPQVFMHNRFSATNNEDRQDTKQVWFAGVHADIGGGYPEAESALSKYPLIWMIDEAVKCGLSVDRRTVNHLAWGVKRKGSPFNYVVPDYRGTLHDSLTLGWKALEVWPKSEAVRDWKGRRCLFGYYLPLGEPRAIQEEAFIHESAVRRRESGAYKPINFPTSFEVVPMEGMNDS
jgi:uncharacterized protein (DUF2235 family)